MKVSIRQGTGNYWNGSSFGSSSEFFNTTTLGTAGGTSTTWKFALARPADGSYTIHVQTADTIGNAQSGTTYAATSNFAIDTAGPTVSSINRATSSPTNASSVSWTVSFSEPVNGVTASNFSLANTGLTGPSITGVTGTAPTATWTVTAVTGTGNGSLGLNLANSTGVTDAGGNALTTASFTGQIYTIDRSAPAAITNLTLGVNQDTGSSSTDGITNINTPAFGGTAEANSTITLFNGAAVVGSGTTDGTGAFTATINSALPDGTYNITAKATDAAGNVSGVSNTKQITIDTVAPTGLTISCVPSGNKANCSGLAGHGTNDVANNGLTVVICATNSFPCASPQETKQTTAAPSTGAWSTTGTANLGNNSNHFAQLTQTDLAGNAASVVSSQFST